MIKTASEQNKDNKGWYSIFHDSGQAIDYLITKKYFGEELDSKDAELLMRTLWQAKDKPLSNEIADTIKNNKDLFRNQKGLNVDNEDSIRNFSNEVAKNSCFLNTILGNLALSPLMDNIPKSFGDMYKKLYEKGFVSTTDGISVTVNINDLSGIQRIVDALVGEDRLVVEGVSINQGKSSTDVFNILQNIMKNTPVTVAGIRITGHNFLVFDGKTYDTGRPGNPYGPRNYGSKITDWAGRENTSSFWWLK